jgi:hypothetical protein
MTPGFKGWLLVLVVAQWVTFLKILAGMARSLATVDPELSRDFPILPIVDHMANAVSLSLATATLLVMMKKGQRFPGYFKLQFAWTVTGLPLSATAGYLVMATVYQTPVDVGVMLTELAPDIGGWIGSLIVGGLWLVYVIRSRRVQMTFTR